MWDKLSIAWKDSEDVVQGQDAYLDIIVEIIVRELLGSVLKSNVLQKLLES